MIKYVVETNSAATRRTVVAWVLTLLFNLLVVFSLHRLLLRSFSQKSLVHHIPILNNIFRDGSAWSATEALIRFVAIATIHLMYIFAFWKQRLRKKNQLPSVFPPIWKKCFMGSPAYALMFIYSSIASNMNPGNQISQLAPRHIWVMSLFLAFLAEMFRIFGLCITIDISFHLHTFAMLVLQCGFSFGLFKDESMILEAYRHKPRFAIASCFQLLLYTLNGIFRFSHIITYVLIFTSNATLSVFLTDFREPSRLADPVLELHVDTATHQFCQTCELRILPHLRTRRSIGFIPHHRTQRDLRNSALLGCRICSSVWQFQSTHILRDFRALLTFWKYATSFSIEFPREGIGDLVVRSEKSRKLDANLCRFKLFQISAPSPESPESYSPSYSKLTNHTGSLASLDTAARWLQICRDHHIKCAMSSEYAFVPSRLIYLQDGKDGVRLRLYTKGELPQDVQYMTLSHCWGSSQRIKLTKATLDAFHTDIPLNQLPKTFQDAVRITRHLRCEYLWIDSLCIIQDSQEDWKHEAAEMGDVYKYSLCSIAASDASDSMQGCLYARNPVTIQPELVKIQTATGSLQHFLLVNETDLYDQHPLYSRAWVFQEALLATRILDCGKGQLFWRCAQGSASEIFPDGPIPRFSSGLSVIDHHPVSHFKGIVVQNGNKLMGLKSIQEQLTVDMKGWKASAHANQGVASVSQLHSSKGILMMPCLEIPQKFSSCSVVSKEEMRLFTYWAQVVNSYTRMDLTNLDDRPIAIMGINDIFQPFFGWYRCGLWRIFMLYELLWATGPGACRAESDRAPTWSWTSIDGPVTYWRGPIGDEPLLLANYISDAEEKFKNERELKLNAILLRARWSKHGSSRRAYHCVSHVEDKALYDDAILGYHLVPQDAGYGTVCFDNPRSPPRNTGLYCVPIILKPKRGVCGGLMVRERPDGCYERVGYFQELGPYFIQLLSTVTTREIVLV